MTKKCTMCLCSAITLVVLCVWLYWGQTSTFDSDTSGLRSASGKQGAAIACEKHCNQTNESAGLEGAERARLVALFNAISHKKNRTVSFCGRIIDQDGNAVTGQAVVVDAMFSHIVPENKVIQIVSDQDGRFCVKGMVCRFVHVKLLPRDEYEFANNGILSFTSDDKPQPGATEADAYVFKAWRKKGRGQDLYHRAIDRRVPFDEKVYYVDFRSRDIGVVPDNADIGIVCSRPQGKLNGIYDWSFTLRGVRWEIVEANDAFVLEAPVDGYSKKWQIEQRANDDHYDTGCCRWFYVRLPIEKLYGKMRLIVFSHYDSEYFVQMEVWVNRSGSRNVESDSAKIVKWK